MDKPVKWFLYHIFLVLLAMLALMLHARPKLWILETLNKTAEVLKDAQ